MKAMVVLLLASLPVPQVQVSPRRPAPQDTHFVQSEKAAQHKGGRWYLARSGHAVYCYGPVMTVAGVDGELERVATFCHGNQLLVPLKD